MMRNKPFSSARIIIIVLLIFPCCIISPVKAETIFTRQRIRIKPHKKLLQKRLGFFIPKIHTLNNTKKSITKKLYSTSIENYFLNRLRKLPSKNSREFPIQKMLVRRDIDYKILSMHVRKDIKYLILDITP